MADRKQVVLVSPDGRREWTPESKAEEFTLRQRGYRDKPAEAVKPGPPAGKSAVKPADK